MALVKLAPAAEQPELAAIFLGIGDRVDCFNRQIGAAGIPTADIHSRAKT